MQQGVLQNGMGPIAKKLTLQEAGRTRERENTSSPVDFRTVVVETNG